MRRHASSRHRSCDADRDADDLNNDLVRDRRNSAKSQLRKKTEQLCEATTVVERLSAERNVAARAEKPQDAVRAVDVEIWTSSAFLRDRIGSAPHRKGAAWLRVVGNGCSSARTHPVLRPATAPATVKSVHLTPRSPFNAYRPYVAPTPRLPTRRPKPPKTAEKSPQLGVRGKETLCEKKKKENDAASAKKKSVIVVGEMARRDQLKNRRAIAKSKAEKTFRQLLDLDEEDAPDRPSLRFPPYIEPNPVAGSVARVRERLTISPLRVS